MKFLFLLIFKGRKKVTDEYSVQSGGGLCVRTGQLGVGLVILKVV
jgi:hypothetical protein